MLKLVKGGNNSVYMNFVRNLSCNLSFYISGLTSFARVIFLNEIASLTKKKLLFITASEQNALKYQNDLSKAFDIDARLYLYQLNLKQL